MLLVVASFQHSTHIFIQQNSQYLQSVSLLRMVSQWVAMRTFLMKESYKSEFFSHEGDKQYHFAAKNILIIFNENEQTF